MYVSTPLPLLEFADTLESYGGLSPSIFIKHLNL